MTVERSNRNDNIIDGYKICSKCHREKPFGQAWFHREPYGVLTDTCLACYRPPPIREIPTKRTTPKEKKNG